MGSAVFRNVITTVVQASAVTRCLVLCERVTVIYFHFPYNWDRCFDVLKYRGTRSRSWCHVHIDWIFSDILYQLVRT